MKQQDTSTPSDPQKPDCKKPSVALRVIGTVLGIGLAILMLKDSPYID